MVICIFQIYKYIQLQRINIIANICFTCYIVNNYGKHIFKKGFY